MKIIYTVFAVLLSAYPVYAGTVPPEENLQKKSSTKEKPSDIDTLFDMKTFVDPDISESGVAFHPWVRYYDDRQDIMRPIKQDSLRIIPNSFYNEDELNLVWRTIKVKLLKDCILVPDTIEITYKDEKFPIITMAGSEILLYARKDMLKTIKEHLSTPMDIYIEEDPKENFILEHTNIRVIAAISIKKPGMGNILTDQ